MLNVLQVDYGSQYAHGARTMRRTRSQQGKNVATICLTNGREFTRPSIPPGPPGVTPQHSEQAVWEAVWFSGELSRNNRIVWVYTERYPCGFNPGMRNCYGFLEGILTTYGAHGIDTPVYYTYEYPDTSHMLFTLRWCLAFYEECLKQSPADQQEICNIAPKAITIGSFMHQNGIGSNNASDAGLNFIALELYSIFRDEAIAELINSDGR
jgi:hypothetical protein